MSLNAVVQLRKNEPIDHALKRLKAKVEREGVLDTIRAKRGFETPTQKRKRKAKRQIKVNTALKNKRNAQRNNVEAI